jgi:hypothetical protein
MGHPQINSAGHPPVDIIERTQKSTLWPLSLCRSARGEVCGWGMRVAEDFTQIVEVSLRAGTFRE